MARLAARFGLTRYEADELYREAIKAYQDGNIEQAILKMNDAIILLPTRAEYYAARGLFSLEHGLKSEAESDFEHALKQNPYEMLANYGRGVLAYQRKQYPEARHHFTAAWSVDPQRAETLYYMALVEHRQKNNPKALHWMQQALKQFDANEAREHDPKRQKREADRKRDTERWIAEFERLIAQPPLL